MQLTQIEHVFKTLKDDLSIRPIYLQVTLEQRLKASALAVKTF